MGLTVDSRCLSIYSFHLQCGLSFFLRVLGMTFQVVLKVQRTITFMSGIGRYRMKYHNIVMCKRG